MRNTAVGLLLFDPDKRMLILSTSEGEIDYDQPAGMLSFPIEPIVDKEPINQALVRLMVEKIGCGISIIPLDFHKGFNVELSNTVNERISLFVGKCDLSFDARPRTPGVKFYGWMPRRAIVNLAAERIRPGVEKIIGSYTAC